MSSITKFLKRTEAVDCLIVEGMRFVHIIIVRSGETDSQIGNHSDKTRNAVVMCMCVRAFRLKNDQRVA